MNLNFVEKNLRKSIAIVIIRVAVCFAIVVVAMVESFLKINFCNNKCSVIGWFFFSFSKL